MQDQVPNQDEPGRNEAGPDSTANEARAPLVLPKPGFVARIKNSLLDLDASLDFGLFRGFRLAREAFERYRDIMDRFHVAGWRRWLVVEPLSEMATMGLGGLVLMLALAGPAFRETSDEDWLKKSELAVTFLDRYGNEVGSRGIKHNHSVPLDELPDHLIKAVLATEDRRFYEHFGIDIPGTFRAVLTNARAGGVVQGGSSITQQLAKNLFLSNERTIERKVKEAFLALWLESRLTKNEILKLYLDRAYMGGGAFGVDAAANFYFGKSAREVNLAGSRDARRPVQGADQVRAAHQPAGRARPRQRRARQSGRGRLHDRGPGVRRPPQSGPRDRPPRRRRAELLPRLGLRRDEEARRHLPALDHRPRLRGAHRARSRHAAQCRGCDREPDPPVRPRLPRQAGSGRARRPRRRGARHGRRRRLRRAASSTARPTRCASPAPRSSPMSTRPR